MNEVLKRAHRRARARVEEERAEVVSVTLWIERNKEDAGLVNLSVVATGYDGAFHSDFEIPEADALEALAVPFTLDTLRSILDRDLARAVARDLGLPYER